ncbi:LysE family translocator [Deinococcus aquaedulcis]|uniref:LysE family translocator n=1 Tax=Deinococcus aquaedulcis TaxID=2840455 RepID=UPI001C839FBE|nr:LysE family translocator [Deinococcus aquaedulcis]
MPEPAVLLTFLAASLALLLVPGPSVLYIVARSVHQGRRAGLVSALGVQVGGLVHVLAAVAGVSALVLSSALLFGLLKWLGAAYLVGLGVLTWLRKEPPASGLQDRPEPCPLRQLFAQGVVVNMLNPKTALFFLAFLPQFVQPDRGPVWGQTLVLGLLFLVLATLSDSAYALLAGHAGRHLRGPVAARWQKGLTGGVFVALGIGTAAVQRH